jgi:thioredoxin 1
MTKVEVIDFYADWCGPCKAMGPTMESLIREFDGNETVEIKKINVDQDPETTNKYEIRGIPTLIFLKNGEVAHRVSGLQTREKITAKIEEILEN